MLLPGLKRAISEFRYPGILIQLGEMHFTFNPPRSNRKPACACYRERLAAMLGTDTAVKDKACYRQTTTVD